MKNLCDRAGVKHFGFHAIRHLSASILAKKGIDIPSIQHILRHKHSKATGRYLDMLGITENVLEKVFGKEKKVMV